jgi:hypothetical protein
VLAGIAALVFTSGSDAWSRRRLNADVIDDASALE